MEQTDKNSKLEKKLNFKLKDFLPFVGYGSFCIRIAREDGSVKRKLTAEEKIEYIIKGEAKTASIKDGWKLDLLLAYNVIAVPVGLYGIYELLK